MTVAATMIMGRVPLPLRRKARRVVALRVAHLKGAARETLDQILRGLRVDMTIAAKDILILAAPGQKEGTMITVKDRVRAARRKEVVREMLVPVAHGPKEGTMITVKDRVRVARRKEVVREMLVPVAHGPKEGTMITVKDRVRVAATMIMDQVPLRREAKRVVALRVAHLKEAVRETLVQVVRGLRADMTTAVKDQAQAAHRKEVVKETLGLVAPGNREMAVKVHRMAICSLGDYRWTCNYN